MYGTLIVMADLLWNGRSYEATCPECLAGVRVDFEPAPCGAIEVPDGAIQCQFCTAYIHTLCLPEDEPCCTSCARKYFARAFARIA